MRRLLSIPVLLVMLAMTSPLLACITQWNMTPVERACCAQMRGECEQMPQHSCCRIHVRSDLSSLPAHQPDTIHLSLLSLPVQTVLHVVVPADGSTGSGPQTNDRPPPLIDQLSTIILRI